MGINLSKYKGIIAGSKYIFLLNITDKVFSFIVMLLFARNFPTEVYGQIVTLITLSIVLISIFDLGLPVYLQREIAVNKVIASEILSRVFLSGSILIVLYFTVGLAVSILFFPGIPFVLFAVISLMMYTSFLVTLSNKALSGISQYKIQFISFLIPRLFILAGFLAVYLFYKFEVNLLLLIMSAGILTNLVILLVYLNKNNAVISFRHFSLTALRKILAISLPLGIAVVFNLLYDKIDLLLISIIRGYNDAAFYSVAYGLFKSSTIAFSFLLVSGFTRAAELQREPIAINKFLKEHTILISIICIICTAVLFFFADLIISTFYTGKFENSAVILQILSVGIIAMGLNNLTGIILNGMGYFRIVMYITLYALVMNVVLNAVMIPKYGITASAVLTVVTEYFIFAVEWYYLKRILIKLQSKTAQTA